jgi:hypothetical protein
MRMTPELADGLRIDECWNPSGPLALKHSMRHYAGTPWADIYFPAAAQSQRGQNSND